MTTIDQASVIPDAIDQNSVIPDGPTPPRGGLAEVGTAGLRGALSGLPTLAGRALQFSDVAPDTGRALQAFGESMGQKPWLTLHPEAHGGFVNALASGAEQVAPALAPALAIGAGAAALGAAPALAAGAAITGAGALFGADAGQQTLERAKEAGVAPEVATTAARLNAAQTFAGQTALGFVGGKMLGVGASAIGKAVGLEGAPLAKQVMGQLTGSEGAVMPSLKQLPISAAEAVSLGAAQSAGTAAIESNYGIGDQSPLDAAKDSIVPMLGLTAVLSPLGLVGRAMGVRSAKMRTETLSHGDTAPEIRTKLADEYAAALAKSDPQAAAAFRANAEVAIAHKQTLPVDSQLFTPGAITPPVPEAPTLQLPFNPSPMVVFPDGTVGRSQAEVDSYINALPADQQVAARAKLMGLGAQPAEPAAAPAPAAPALLPAPPAGESRGAGTLYTFPDGTTSGSIKDVESYVNALPENQRGTAMASLLGMAPQPVPVMAKSEFGEAAGLRGQKLAKEYAEYRKDPLAYEAARQAERDAETQAQQAAPEPALNQLPEQPAAVEPPARVNTQLADALEAARKKLDTEAAYRELETRKAAETDKIANLAKGEQQAAAAEAGTIAPDANAPKQTVELHQDLADALTANGETPRKQDVAWVQNKLADLGIDNLPTHQAQIDALQAFVDGQKKPTAGGDRLGMLLEKWKAETPAPETAAEPVVPAPEPAKPATEPAKPAAEGLGTPPASAAELGTNIPASKPDTTAQPPKSAAAQEGLPDNLPAAPTELAARVKGARDKLASLVEDFRTRLRSGEKLSPLEQERFEDAYDLRTMLDEQVQQPANKYDKAQVTELENMAEQTGKPYTESLRHMTPDSAGFAPNAPIRAQAFARILGPAAESGNLHDMLGHLATTAMTPENQALAGRLRDLNLQTKVAAAADGGAGVAGDYSRRRDAVTLFPSGTTEHTALHEAVHAATVARLDRAELMARAETTLGDQSPIKPRNQTEAQMLSAYKDLETLRQHVLANSDLRPGRDGAAYGLTNAAEFLAELNTSRDFQQLLKDTKMGQKTMWQRAVEAVKKLLGLKTDTEVTALDKAMSLQDVFFGSERPGTLDAQAVREAPARFDKSPPEAAKVTDDVLQHVLSTGEREPLDFARTLDNANRALFQKTLGWKTVQFIADRVRALPEMVATGFSQGVDAYQAAHRSRNLAAAHLRDANEAYAGRVQQILNKVGDANKARDLSRQMMTIGGEASRMGFDYTKNFADNLAERKDLDPRNKAYIDDIYRQYTQLQRANPEAAKAIVEGEQLGRKMLVTKASTVAANLLDAAAGTARRLQAELARMDPADASRAEMEARVARANLESTLADAFSRRLDFMAPDLKTAKNGDTRRFADGASSELHGRLQALLATANAKLPDGSPLRASLAELGKMYEAQVSNPYFSLGRSGDYFVKIGFKGMDDATAAKLQDALKGTNKVLGDLSDSNHAFFRVDSQDQAQGLHDKLLKAGAGKVVDTAFGKLADRDMVRTAGVSPALRTLLGSLHEAADLTPGLKPDQAALMKETITRELLSMLPETSSRSALMQRRGVPGYDGDFLGSYARRAMGSVHDTSSIYTHRAFADAAKNRSDAIEAMNRGGATADTRTRAQMVDDEINLRYANGMQPMDNSKVNLINSLGHSFYLALSPAFFIRNMAQPYHRGLPILGSRYGFVGSAREIGKATGVAMKVIGNTISQGFSENGMRGVLDAKAAFKDLGLTKGEEGFVQELHDRGELGLGQSRQLQQMAIGGSQRMQDMTRFASMTAQYSEMTNRLAMGLAAYRMAIRDPKMTHESATEYAIQTIDRAMDNFDPSNTARQIGKQGFARSITPLLTAFQNYNLQTMQQIARTVHDGMFNKDQSPAGLQRAKEARREFGGLMATTAMISGAMGLPFVNAFAGVYNTLVSDPDDPSDIRTSAKNWLSDTFGQEVGGILAHGVGHAVGLDTRTFGLQDLLPGSDFIASRQLFQDRIESQSKQMMGPAINAGFDMGLALSKLSDGYYVKGIEQALPAGLKAYYKAAELATNGYTDSKGNPIALEATPWDVGLQALGFQSAKKATQSEAAMDFSASQALQTHRRQVIVDEVYKGIAAGDRSAVDQAIEHMVAFNNKNPTQAITSPGAAVREKLQGLALAEASGTGVTTSKRNFPTLQRDERFAAMPRP